MRQLYICDGLVIHLLPAHGAADQQLPLLLHERGLLALGCPSSCLCSIRNTVETTFFNANTQTNTTLFYIPAGRAKTGSGKTLAFALPVIESLLKEDVAAGKRRAVGRPPRALIIVPTRELANQARADGITIYCTFLITFVVFQTILLDV